MLEFFRLSLYGACTKCTPGGTSAVAPLNIPAALEGVTESSDGLPRSSGGAFLRSLVDIREVAAFRSTNGKGVVFTEHSVDRELTVDGAGLKGRTSLEASV